jgi:hypothetical protein
MNGLAKICKLYGGMTVQGVKWVWDYAQDRPRLASEMTAKEKAESERAKWKSVNPGARPVRRRR